MTLVASRSRAIKRSVNDALFFRSSDLIREAKETRRYFSEGLAGNTVEHAVHKSDEL